MSDYSQVTDFSAKDALAHGNPSKIIYGSDLDTEFSAISTAIASKANTTGVYRITTIGPTSMSGSSAISLTGISAEAKEITIVLNQISISGSGTFAILIGDSGGVETTGYTTVYTDLYNTDHVVNTTESASAPINSTGGAARQYTGNIILSLADISTNTWVYSGVVGTYTGGGVMNLVAGAKSLSATLDRVQISGASVSFPWDNGAVTLLVKY